MPTAQRHPAAEDHEIRALIEHVARAVRAGDADALLALCEPDVVVFDLMPPLIHSGLDAVRAVWAAALEGYAAPLEYEVFRLEVAVDGAVAVAHAVTRFGGARRDGTQALIWLRVTWGLKRGRAGWRIAHQHASVPFDMDSREALVDLAPHL